MRTTSLHGERQPMAPPIRSFDEHLPPTGVPCPPQAAPPPQAASEQIADWLLDRRARTVRMVTCDPATAVPLTDCEFSLATALFHALGHPVSRSRLRACASLYVEIDSADALNSHLDRLQRKLQAHTSVGVRLQTLYGHGYRLLRTELAHAAVRKT